ncbi:MAG: hypothetical protein RL136_741 [Planctomycetota bacterium]
MSEVRRRHSLATLRAARGASGFTIVELLVVVAVISILISLISVGVVSAGSTARQTKALSGLKQVGTAWGQYATQNEDRCMLGYMDDGVQAEFKYKVRDAAGDRVPAQFCRTYPFRLLPFLDHDRSILYDYITDYEDEANIPPQEIADTPAYGYNAYYLGGWYTMQNGAPRLTYANTGYFRSPGQLVPGQEMVARTTTQIQKTSDMILFASSYRPAPGFYKAGDNLVRGAAWVSPHKRGQTDVWAASDGLAFENITVTMGDGDVAPGAADLLAAAFLRTDARSTAVLVQGVSGIQVFIDDAVPLRRYKNAVPTVRADNSTSAQGLNELMNQSRWMNNANFSSDPVEFSHPD